LQAYDHAKAASVATQTSETTVAINEHALAAGEFAKAADQTCSQEALRTLKLLETHHQRLSELLKFPAENPIVPSAIADADLATATEKNVSTSAAVAELRGSKNEDTKSASSRRTPPNSSLHVPRRMPPREMSSSIASNLASARGIRSSGGRRALSPGVTLAQAPGSLESPRRSNRPANSEVPGKPSWLPPVSHEQVAKVAVTEPTIPSETLTPASEEGFQRFYSTFESLISKLSAPLAFAGLPLISEESSSIKDSSAGLAEPPKPRHPSGRSASTTGEPDLSKYISRAALRASAKTGPVNDSFYVVPTTGHTASYANILSYAEKEKRRLAASAHLENPDLFEDPDNDDFVDAREHPMPPSPVRSRTMAKSSKSGKELENMVEELYTENKSLKECIDHLSKRLHTFESAAQSSTLALQESIRMYRPSSPAVLPRQGSSAGNEAEFKALAAKVRVLEEQLDVEAKERQMLARENEKLKMVVSRYRERWEKLKEGAKTRRGEAGPKDGAGGSGEAGGRFIAG